MTTAMAFSFPKLAGFVVVVLLMAGARPSTQDNWTFKQSLGDLLIAATKGQYDESIVTLTDKRGERTVKGTVGFPLDRVHHAVRESRLILLAKLDAPYLAVLDPDAARVVDEFWGTRVAVSPSARFIAYNQRVPRWADASALYLVYDVSLSPTANRMPDPQGNISDGPRDVGRPVYPNENRTRASYETTFYSIREENKDSLPPPDVLDAMHELVSPLTWLSENQFAFVDRVGPEFFVVVIDLSAGVEAAKVRTAKIDTTELIDTSKAEDGDPAARAYFVAHPWAYLWVTRLTARETSRSELAMRVEWKSQWANERWLRKSSSDVLVHE
ncbi:MAG: hypothetical protein QM736_07525 [Vicinamibacterales bacterium]